MNAFKWQVLNSKLIFEPLSIEKGILNWILRSVLSNTTIATYGSRERPYLQFYFFIYNLQNFVIWNHKLIILLCPLLCENKRLFPFIDQRIRLIDFYLAQAEMELLYSDQSCPVMNPPPTVVTMIPKAEIRCDQMNTKQTLSFLNTP